MKKSTAIWGVYKVQLSRTAEKFYIRIHQRDSKLFERVRAVLVDLTREPFQGKPLTGELKGRFSYRLGSYRIIYLVLKESRTVTVLDIGHRKEVYRT